MVTVDAESVIRLLRAQPGLENAEIAAPPEPLTGGFWASISVLRLANVPPGTDRLVLRIMPDPAIAAKEAVFHREVARQRFPVPAVRLAAGSDAGLGAAFLVMEHAAGRMPLGGLGGLAAARRLPSIARTLPVLLGEVTARLHGLDPWPARDALRDAAVSVPADAPAMLDWLRAAAADAGRPDLAAAARWLAANPPPSGRQAICHGDIHPFNLLVDGDRWTLLDWTTALIADPAFDLAYTIMMLRRPPLAAPPPVRALLSAAGTALARRFLAAYRRAGGMRPDSAALRWFSCLHALRIVVEVDSWHRDGGPGRPDHPWTAMAPWAARQLARTTGNNIRQQSADRLTASAITR
jgi:aminoglycoside phosphotransferase (APT) family kinase protein